MLSFLDRDPADSFSECQLFAPTTPRVIIQNIYSVNQYREHQTLLATQIAINVAQVLARPAQA